MPGMIESAAWNLVVHGARGIIWWPADFWDMAPGKDPQDRPYPGASVYGYWAFYEDHQWDPQYAAARHVDREIESLARQLNSPTVSGISAMSSSNIPVATLGKDVAGKLWLLAQADGDPANPLSNTTPITATLTLPASVRAGTVLDVIGENRTVTVDARHQISDRFDAAAETPAYSGAPISYGYQHHVYAMP
jgi:hypothetical protein